jgi:hypothetical protein
MKKILFLTALSILLFYIYPVFSQDFANNEIWFSYNDKNSGGSSEIQMSVGEETIGGSAYTVTSVTGKVTTQYQYGFIGFGYAAFSGDEATLAKLKTAKGIKFKVIGDGKSYRFRAETTVVKDSDYHGKIFSTEAGKVVEVYIPYSDLRQEGWGKAVGGFKKDKLWQISFQTVGQPHPSISLKVFDLQIVQ